MKKSLQQTMLAVSLLLLATAVSAKLPAPSDEAKAKAASAAAKTAWSGKVAGYHLCKSQDKVAAHFYKTAKASGKESKPTAALPACTDPGPFVDSASAAVAAPKSTTPPATGVPAKKS